MKIPFKGIAYKLLIDPLLSGLHHTVLKEIASSDRVLDVACGTGTLALAISKKAKSVTGIDISDEMIETARRSTNRKRICNAAFITMDATEMRLFRDKEFDVAVTSMAVHQFDHDIAISILAQMKRVASRIIIADYNHTMPAGFYKKLAGWIESIAGGDHYRNFKRYIETGGITHFLEISGLKVKSAFMSGGGIFIICVCDTAV
jgi:ubiquinone/menaquinone biosynthesis C-methylase UbiE